MRRATFAAAALLGLGAALLAGTPAFAGYAAIAWDQETGKRGWSWNQSTQQRADEMALSECGASGCKVVTRIGPARCGALATSEDGKLAGAAGRKTRDAARLAALKDCPKKSGECIVRVTDCNK
jgi:serine/threonine-protein kinase